MPVDRVFSKQHGFQPYGGRRKAGRKGCQRNAHKSTKNGCLRRVPCKRSPVYRQLAVQRLLNSDPLRMTPMTPEVSAKIVRVVRNMHEQADRRHNDQRSIDPSASNAGLVMDTNSKTVAQSPDAYSSTTPCVSYHFNSLWGEQLTTLVVFEVYAMFLVPLFLNNDMNFTMHIEMDCLAKTDMWADTADLPRGTFLGYSRNTPKIPLVGGIPAS